MSRQVSGSNLSKTGHNDVLKFRFGINFGKTDVPKCSYIISLIV